MGGSNVPKRVFPMILAIPRKSYFDIRGGTGVSVRRLGDDSFVLEGKKPKQFSCPWEVVVDVNTKLIYIEKGYVNSLEPTINGEPISGVYPDGSFSGVRPSLSLSGVACVLLKITPNANGTLDSSAPYLASPSSVTVELGDLSDAQEYNSNQLLHPLAIVSDGGKMFQLAHFNILYQASKPRGKDDWVHVVSAEPVFSRSIKDKIAAMAKESDA